MSTRPAPPSLKQLRAAERALLESEARLEKFMLATVEGIVFHTDGLITDANPPLCALLGYALQELVGRPVLDFLMPEERERVRRLNGEERELHLEAHLCHRDGHAIACELMVRRMNAQGQQLRMTIVRDIRDRLAAQERIHFLAHHDALTQLLNRTAFLERMELAIAHAETTGRQLALLFIDLDNFKRVNDSLGHLEGDKVLRTVAERLSACLRSRDMVGRFGGDEFLVLLSDVNARTDVQVVLAALLNVVQVPVQAAGRALSVTPSIGVALFPEHGRSGVDLIKHADTAMYAAKTSGRAAARFFEPALATQAYADLVLEGELVQALARSEFQLFYQPQIAAQGGHLVGVEALLRWRHPRRGLLAPDAFLAVAERHHLMLPLSEWVLHEAARQCRIWHDNGVAAVPIAVNLSSMQFRLEQFDSVVAQVLSEQGIPGAWLELELTERILVDDIQHVPERLAALRRLGLRIAVDDFGTGYTSLAHLTQLPVDKLKIDQSFVAGLPHDAGAVAITKAIVQIGLALGLEVSAEGVRNAAQRDLLTQWGCHELQGELISMGLSSSDLEAWLAAR